MDIAVSDSLVNYWKNIADSSEDIYILEEKKFSEAQKLNEGLKESLKEQKKKSRKTIIGVGVGGTLLGILLGVLLGN